MTNDRPPVPQPAAEPPLGIQRPFLPPVTLGQSLLQPKFLTPLGARSLSVLDPTIFSSGQDADLPAWESPFQDSPFFDPPPAARSPDPAPAVQTKPRPTASNPAINPTIAPVPAPQFESVANLSPVDLSPVDLSPESEFSQPTFAPPEPISASEFPQPESIVPEPIVQRSPENLSPENSPVPASEATTIAPILPAETPVFRAELEEPTFPSNLAEPERSTPFVPAPEASIFVPATTLEPTAEAAIQRVENPEAAAPAIEPILAEEAIDPEPVSATDLAPAIQAKLEPTVSPSAPSISNSVEPTIARLVADPAIESGEPSPPAPLPEERGAGVGAPILEQRSESDQALTREISPNLSAAESVELASLSIEPASIEPAANPSPSRDSESNFSPSSNLESTPNETVQRSVVEPAPIDFEPENSVETIAPEAVNNRADSPETVQRKVEGSTPTETRSEPENSGKAIATSPVDDRADSPETVQRKVDGSPPTETRIEESNQAISTVGSTVEPDSSTESVSAQSQPMVERVDLPETPSESPPASLPQVAAIDPIQSQSIDLPQIQAPSETTPSLVQAKQIPSESLSNSNLLNAPENISETLTPQISETENFSQQSIQPSVENQQAQPSIQLQPSLQASENSPQAEDVAESTVQPKVEKEAIALESIAPVEQSASTTQPPIQLKPENLAAESFSSPPIKPDTIEAETISSPVSESDRPETIQPLATQPIVDNLASPIQRKITDAEVSVSEPSSTLTSEAIPETEIAQNPAPAIDYSAFESQPSPIEEIVLPPTSAIEPALQRSTSEAQPTDEILTPLSRETENDSFLATPTSLPELPTVIQRLSILEPIAQMKPLYSSTDSPAVQPTQPKRSPSIPELQTQQFDRLFDLPSEPPSVMRKSNAVDSNVAAPDTASIGEPIATEWSSIAELFEAPFEASETSRSAPQSEDFSDRDSDLNGYADLNLSSTKTAPSDIIQAKLKPPNQISETSGAGAIEPSSESHNSAPAPASPEQLERLAQEIYQLVRQRLALERERFGKSGLGRSL